MTKVRQGLNTTELFALVSWKEKTKKNKTAQECQGSRGCDSQSKFELLMTLSELSIPSFSSACERCKENYFNA